VLSELIRPQQDTSVLAWFRSQTDADMATTCINQAEVLGGLLRLPAGKRRVAMLQAVTGLWTQDMAGRVFGFDARAAQLHADIVAKRFAMGRPISFPDAAIAAIARGHQAAVVTRDTGGFEHCGIGVVNPWLFET
jgi:toxin FitB